MSSPLQMVAVQGRFHVFDYVFAGTLQDLSPPASGAFPVQRCIRTIGSLGQCTAAREPGGVASLSFLASASEGIALLKHSTALNWLTLMLPINIDFQMSIPWKLLLLWLLTSPHP